MTCLGLAGYPAMRMVVLAETGTRGLLAPSSAGGRAQRGAAGPQLVPLLREGMLLLADRAYDAAELLKEPRDRGALLVRAAPPVSPRPGGLARRVLPVPVDGLGVRIIEAALDVHGADGTRLGDGYRLITTLLDWRRYPAGELIRLYHERWEIEVAYLALRHTLLGGYVLRSRDRAGAEQELWALLTVYQALRMAMWPRPGLSRAPTRPGQLHRALEPRGSRSSPRAASRPRRPGDSAGSAAPSSCRARPAGTLQRPE